MVKTAALTICVAFLVLSTTVNAQDKKAPTTTPPVSKLPGPGATETPGSFDLVALLKEKMAAQKAELKKLIAKHGKDSAEVRKAQQSLREIERFAEQTLLTKPGIDAAALAPPISTTASLPAGLDAATLAPPISATTSLPTGLDAAALAPPIGTSTATMMRDYLLAASTAGGQDGVSGLDQADPGRIAMDGLEFELKALAAEIRKTEDAAVKKAKTDELREIAETMVVLRTRYRKKTIKRLEERLAALKAEDKDNYSVESLLDRLLPKPEKPKTDKPKTDKPKERTE